MKAIFEGLKRAKLRTILSVITVFIVTIAICVVMGLPIGMSRDDAQMPQIEENAFAEQQFEEQTTDANNSNSEITSETDSEENSDTGDGENDNRENAVNGQYMDKGVNTSCIIATAIGAAGVILLIIINASSTKKRKEEFAQMQINNIPAKAIKKQLFTETFAVVLIVGIVGAGTGTAISQPISKAVMSNFQSEAQNFSESEIGEFEMPEDFDMKNPPDEADDNSVSEMPSEEAQTKSENGNTDEAQQSDDSEIMVEPSNENKSFDRENIDNRSSSTWLNLVVGIIAVLVMSIVSGLSCSLPVKKVETIANVKSEESDE